MVFVRYFINFIGFNFMNCLLKVMKMLVFKIDVLLGIFWGILILMGYGC